MKKHPIISLLFVMFCCHVPLSTYAQSLQTPEQIFEQTFSSYAQLMTYQDRGWAEEVFKRSDSSLNISTTTFSTFIKRPDKLRMEWHDSRFAEQRRSVLTSDLQGINLFLAWRNRYTWMDSSGGNWGTAFGVSGKQTYTVPAIMEVGYTQNLPGTNNLASLRELRLLESQEFEGELCYVIAGKWHADIDYRIWIGVNDHLIRQIEKHIQSFNKLNKEFGGEQKQDGDRPSKLFPTDSTDSSLSFREIYREIKINQPINDEVFQFSPPPGAKFVEPDNLSGSKDSFWNAYSDKPKRWFWVPLIFLILFFGVVGWIIRGALRKKIADPK